MTVVTISEDSIDMFGYTITPVCYEKSITYKIDRDSNEPSTYDGDIYCAATGINRFVRMGYEGLSEAISNITFRKAIDIHVKNIINDYNDKYGDQLSYYERFGKILSETEKKVFFIKTIDPFSTDKRSFNSFRHSAFFRCKYQGCYVGRYASVEFSPSEEVKNELHCSVTEWGKLSPFGHPSMPLASKKTSNLKDGLKMLNDIVNKK